MAVIPDPLAALSSRLAFPARTVDGYHPSVKNIFGRIQFPHLIFACSTNIDAQISSWSAMWTAFFNSDCCLLKATITQAAISKLMQNIAKSECLFARLNKFRHGRDRLAHTRGHALMHRKL